MFFELKLFFIDFMKRKTNNFFICLSVFDIILRVSQGEQWEEAILSVLPPRKLKPAISRRRAKLILAEAQKAENEGQEAVVVADEKISTDVSSQNAQNTENISES